MRILACAIAVALVAAIPVSALGGDAAANQLWVYFGTYTGRKSQGIYVSKFDAATGKLGDPELAAETLNPTFLTAGPSAGGESGPYFLYAVNETEMGTITSYLVDRGTGKLTLLNQKPSAGAAPCHVSLDAHRKFLYAANYGDGTTAALPIKADGTLDDPATVIRDSGSSVNKQRQQGPHAHWVGVDPGNRFVLSCDLGIDRVLVAKFDPAKGMGQPIDSAALKSLSGSGPRHLAFHPNGHLAYVVNELSNTVTALTWDGQNGKLNAIQTISTLPPNFTGENTASEIQVHPSGKFLYASNRGHDSIAIYKIDPQTGQLSLIKAELTRSKTPRGFCIDPTGQWLLVAHQSSDNVMAFRVNTNGLLSPTGQSVTIGAAVCIQFVPAL